MYQNCTESVIEAADALAREVGMWPCEKCDRPCTRVTSDGSLGFIHTEGEQHDLRVCWLCFACDPAIPHLQPQQLRQHIQALIR